MNVKLFRRCLSVCLLVAPAAFSQTVRFQTNLGTLDVTLSPESAPATVENFLNYVKKGAYDGTFFHRSVANFVIQAGGYKYVDGAPKEIPQDMPVKNEYRISNTRGTIAMAKLGSDPNSATNQWFFNLANNAGNLNNQNGGFTVFGRVSSAAGLTLIDRIAAVPKYDLGSPFDAIPLQNYVSGNTVAESNLIVVQSITILDSAPTPSISGIASAGAFGGFTAAAPGSYIEIYGANLSGSTSRTWAGGDFVSGRAPTTLDGVTVAIDGKPAFVSFISPQQVNVQVPGDVTVDSSVPVVVSLNGRSSAQALLPTKKISAGLLAPASFKVDDKQYVAALHANGSFVSNGKIAGVANAPATIGETLIFYGVGFGPLVSGTVAGQVATGITNVASAVEFQFGGVPAKVAYSGLAPDLVGLYQFNVVVPPGTPAGDVVLKVTVGGEAAGQNLVIPIAAGN